MVQEIQWELNYQRELDEIQWIWYSQRRISDKMQVRDKVSNSWDGGAGITMAYQGVEAMPNSWNTVEQIGWVDYKLSWWKITIPLWWAYMIIYTPWRWYTQTNYYYNIRLYVNSVEVYNKRTSLWEWSPISTMLNLGRGDVLTIWLTSDFGSPATESIRLKLIKL